MPPLNRCRLFDPLIVHVAPGDPERAVAPVVALDRLSGPARATARALWAAFSLGLSTSREPPPRWLPIAATALAGISLGAPAQAQTEISFFYPVAVGGPITKIIDERDNFQQSVRELVQTCKDANEDLELMTAIAYHTAHYLTYLLLTGQYVIPVISDPFGFGWDLFGTISFKPDIALIDAKFAWYTAVIAIVFGMGMPTVAVYVLVASLIAPDST